MPMYSACDSAALPALGFPIRESTGQRLFNASPWLIAVVHALHRLLVPRHPPCALIILTVIGPDPRVRTGDTRIDLANCAVFKVRREARQPHQTPPSEQEAPGTAGLSKLNSMCAHTRDGSRETRASPTFGRHARWPDVHADAGTTPRRSSLERR
jgi:hypothetical protein